MERKTPHKIHSHFLRAMLSCRSLPCPAGRRGEPQDPAGKAEEARLPGNLERTCLAPLKNNKVCEYSQSKKED